MTKRGLTSIAAGGALVLAAFTAGCKNAGSMSTMMGGLGGQMTQGLGGLSSMLSGSTTQPAKPTDAALLAPPDIFVARSDNCLATGELPASPVNDVVACDGSSNLFDVEVPGVTQIGASQKRSDLCWAACTQTLLAQQNMRVDQLALGQHFEPDPDDETASVGTIIRALNQDLEPQLNQKGALPIDLVGLTSDQLIGELLAGHLCVVGLLNNKDVDPVGHACVVCGAKFSRLAPSALGAILASAPAAANNAAANSSAANQTVTAAQPTLNNKLNPVYGLTEVTLFDPEPGVGIRKLTADQFHDQTDFFTSRVLSRQLLMNALNPPAMGTGQDQAAGAASGKTKVSVLSRREDDVRVKSLPQRRLVWAKKKANTPPNVNKKKPVDAAAAAKIQQAAVPSQSKKTN